MKIDSYHFVTAQCSIDLIAWAVVLLDTRAKLLALNPDQIYSDSATDLIFANPICLHGLIEYPAVALWMVD